MAKVIIPTPLRNYTDGKGEVLVDGRTVAEVLRGLTTKHQRLNGQLFNEAGDLRSFVNLFLNDADIRMRDGLETPVAPGDTLEVLPAIAGARAAGSALLNGVRNSRRPFRKSTPARLMPWIMHRGLSSCLMSARRRNGLRATSPAPFISTAATSRPGSRPWSQTAVPGSSAAASPASALSSPRRR
jgi:molybdopterin synthase sulfur carrier subunit